jgi:hypothetical protein
MELVVGFLKDRNSVIGLTTKIVNISGVMGYVSNSCHEPDIAFLFVMLTCVGSKLVVEKLLLRMKPHMLLKFSELSKC